MEFVDAGGASDGARWEGGGARGAGYGGARRWGGGARAPATRSLRRVPWESHGGARGGPGASPRPNPLPEAAPAPASTPSPSTDAEADAAAEVAANAVLDALVASMQPGGRAARRSPPRAGRPGSLAGALHAATPPPGTLATWTSCQHAAGRRDALDRAIDAAGAGLVSLGKVVHLAHGAAWRATAAMVKAVVGG